MVIKQSSKVIHKTTSTDEYLDTVNEDNIPIGNKCLRSAAHSEGLWHRVVRIYFFKISDEIEFLVHLRSKTKDLSPNKWDTRFGGHLKAGESIEETVRGELHDEVGLTLEPSNLIRGEIYKNNKYPNREFVNVFYYKFDGKVSLLKFNDGEVQEVKWMKSSQILKSMMEKPEIWSGGKDGFIEILNVLKSNLMS